MKSIVISLLICLFCSSAYSDCESVLESHVGWTIVASKVIEGYRDPGKQKKDEFEGCDFDRVIYFIDGTTVTCTSYGYQYAYMPTAIILGKSVTYKGKGLTMFNMIVGEDEYAVR